jgi:hypothetical protein
VSSSVHLNCSKGSFAVVDLFLPLAAAAGQFGHVAPPLLLSRLGAATKIARLVRQRHAGDPRRKAGTEAGEADEFVFLFKLNGGLGYILFSYRFLKI